MYLLELLFADLKSQTKIELGDAFILLYAINDRGSFIGTRDLYQVLQQTRAKSTGSQVPSVTSASSSSSSSVPIYLVGSKIDLDNERQVSLEEAKTLAIELRCRKLFEISSKTHVGEIDDLFTKLVKELPRSQSLPQQQQQMQQQSPAPLYRPAKQRSVSQPLTSFQQESSRPGTMSSQAPGSTTSPSTSPRKSSMLDRFKFGSLRRTPSMQSLARKKSDSFGESMRRINSPSSSRDNLKSYPSNTSSTVATSATTSANANGSASAAKKTPSSPYKLDLDTSSWGSFNWPAEMIPEEDSKMK